MVPAGLPVGRRILTIATGFDFLGQVVVPGPALLVGPQPFTSSNSTSKISVAFGGITPPAPRSP
jgi:hypothetical protein